MFVRATCYHHKCLTRFMADRSRAPVPGVPFENIIVASEAKREPEPKQRETQSTERDRAKAKRDPEQRETQSRHTWRMLADALTKLVCGSMLGAALSGQRFTAPPLMLTSKRRCRHVPRPLLRAKA